MTLQQTLNQQGLESRKVDYDGRTAHILDFGPAASVSADIVGNTTILVVDDEQYEITLADDAEVFVNNGVVTIEVDA